jgi:hypothetical protein
MAQDLLTRLAVHNPDEKGYSLEQGLIKYKGKVWIAHNSALQTRLIAALHSSVVGGHSGMKATYYSLKKLFQWKELKTDVENFIKQCQVCQQAKHEHNHPAGLLQPLPIPKGAWQDISMDFIEGLPLSHGCNSILVVVDRYTKYAHFLPLNHPFTAQGVARLVLDNVVKLHGLPKSIVSDRDRIFTSIFWKELFSLFDTSLLISSSYHPQTDGQTERVNQCLEMYLRCAVQDSPKTWKVWLPLAELWYNSSFHSAIGCSPFKALYGYEATSGMTVPALVSKESEVVDFIQDREAHLANLQKHLAAAQNRMKLQADKHRTDRQFQVGELVLLKLQPYIQHSVVNRPFPKLSYKLFGPYRILEKMGAAAYKLDVPSGSLSHPVFHISQLKPFRPNSTLVFADITKLQDFSALDLKPE